MTMFTLNQAVDDALDNFLETQIETNDRAKPRNRFLASLAASGFAVVPVEATDVMVLAALDRHQRDDEVMHASIWRAMLAAAQKEQNDA